MEKTPPGDQSVTPTAESAKRKAEQANGTQMRTKRNRYISIAWYDNGLISPEPRSLGFFTCQICRKLQSGFPYSVMPQFVQSGRTE